MEERGGEFEEKKEKEKGRSGGQKERGVEGIKNGIRSRIDYKLERREGDAWGRRRRRKGVLLKKKEDQEKYNKRIREGVSKVGATREGE